MSASDETTGLLTAAERDACTAFLACDETSEQLRVVRAVTGGELGLGVVKLVLALDDRARTLIAAARTEGFNAAVQSMQPPKPDVFGPEEVQRLRERTGAGMMSCTRALVATNGDHEAAVLWLRGHAKYLAAHAEAHRRRELAAAEARGVADTELIDAIVRRGIVVRPMVGGGFAWEDDHVDDGKRHPSWRDAARAALAHTWDDTTTPPATGATQGAG